MYKFSFIGTGNMGGAIAKAVCKSVDSSEVVLSNKTSAKAASLAKELSCSFGDNLIAAKEGKFIFIGVKPQILKIREISYYKNYAEYAGVVRSRYYCILSQ